MMDKLNCALLVDDDNGCNFLHKRLIKKSERVENIEVANDGLEAMEFLKTPRPDGTFPKPDIIFLDINMPRMNGWQFLDAYHELPVEQKGEIVLIMLTSSLNPDDKARAEEYNEVAGLHYKLLSKESLADIFNTYFPHLTT